MFKVILTLLMNSELPQSSQKKGERIYNNISQKKYYWLTEERKKVAYDFDQFFAFNSILSNL